MSFNICDDPQCNSQNQPNSVDTVIIPRTGDIGGFFVQRALPSKKKRMIGPFIFWDEMGPGEFLEGKGLDVRPHPHIGLSTVTYLFDGTMVHKDSLGNDMTVHPGDVNLMTAGHGIVHSERTGPEARRERSTLFGIQSWLALPKHLEESEPNFQHTEKKELPLIKDAGLSAQLVMGQAFGAKSPVHTNWETLYVDVRLEVGSKVPFSKETEERGVFLVSGMLEIDGHKYDKGCMISLRPGEDITIKALKESHLLLIGGAAMDGPRVIWWNFVASSVEKVREAAERWEKGAFPIVPGDEVETIALPDISALDHIKI